MAKVKVNNDRIRSPIKLLVMCTVIFLIYKLVTFFPEYSPGRKEKFIDLAKMDTSRKAILMTNGLNFFGVESALKLRQRGDRVVVVDFFVEDSPLVSLERDKWVSKLQNADILVLRANPCNPVAMNGILSKYFKMNELTHVLHFHERRHSFSEVLQCFSDVAKITIAHSESNTEKPMELIYDADGSESSGGDSFYAIANHFRRESKIKISGIKRDILFGQGLQFGNPVEKLFNFLLGYNQPLEGRPLVLEDCDLFFTSIKDVGKSLLMIVDNEKEVNTHPIYHVGSRSGNVKMLLKDFLKILKSRVQSKLLIDQQSSFSNNILKIEIKEKSHVGHKHSSKNLYSHLSNPILTASAIEPQKNDVSELLDWFSTVLVKYHTSIDKDVVPLREKGVLMDAVTINALQNWTLYGGGSGRAVIFSTYFTSKTDPQRGKKVMIDNFNYIRKWYQSVKELGLEAIVFCDGLGPEFIEKYSTDKIQFRKVELGSRSTNDERFFIYHNYLQTHTDIKAVFMTDISDVFFRLNPFDLVKTIGNRLYVGKDRGKSMTANLWLEHMLRKCLVQKFDKNLLERVKNQRQVYNAGVIGGYTSEVIPFLEKITGYLQTPNKRYNCNMPVFNYAVHLHFSVRVFTGFPLTSLFFQKEHSPEGVYIVHK